MSNRTQAPDLVKLRLKPRKPHTPIYVRLSLDGSLVEFDRKTKRSRILSSDPAEWIRANCQMGAEAKKLIAAAESYPKPKVKPAEKYARKERVYR